MKLTPFFLAAIAPALALGCTGTTFLGHFAVLAVTVGIFVGTLSMGRTRLSNGTPIAPSDEAQANSITTNVDPQ